MKHFGRTEVKEVRSRLQTVVDKLGEELSIEFKVGTIRFSDSRLSAKVEALPLEVGENGKNAQQTEFERMATMYEGNGANPTWYGREFTLESGRVFKVTGWRRGATKNVINLLDVNKGKEYFSSIKFVAQYLK